jgi:hypothetical protein
MTDTPPAAMSGRMLLSHNFTLDEQSVQALNREDFANVFIHGLMDTVGINCAFIDHPHWIVEVSYDAAEHSADSVGQRCAETLANYRKKHHKNNSGEHFTVMALGGQKQTPPTGPLPALQTGQWGVDVVETREPETFLAEINWNKLAGAKPAQEIFRLDCEV